MSRAKERGDPLDLSTRSHSIFDQDEVLRMIVLCMGFHTSPHGMNFHTTEHFTVDMAALLWPGMTPSAEEFGGKLTQMVMLALTCKSMYQRLFGKIAKETRGSLFTTIWPCKPEWARLLPVEYLVDSMHCLMETCTDLHWQSLVAAARPGNDKVLIGDLAALYWNEWINTWLQCGHHNYMIAVYENEVHYTNEMLELFENRLHNVERRLKINMQIFLGICHVTMFVVVNLHKRSIREQNLLFRKLQDLLQFVQWRTQYTPMYWWQFNMMMVTIADVVGKQVRVRATQAHLNHPYLRLQEIVNNVSMDGHLAPGPTGRWCNANNQYGPDFDERRTCAFNLEDNMDYAAAVRWDADDIQIDSEKDLTFARVLDSSSWLDGVPVVYYGFASYTLDAYRFREIMHQAVLQGGYLASDMPKMVSEALEVDTGILETLEEGIKSYM